MRLIQGVPIKGTIVGGPRGSKVEFTSKNKQKYI